MKVLKILVLMAACMTCGYTSAQDLIVKKDGSVIQAKVMKVGTSEVEYKKWNNQDGPQYSIAVADILAINYKNGEKETFENVAANGNNHTSEAETEQHSGIIQVKTEDLSQEARAANDALIGRINAPVEFVLVDKHKKDKDDIGAKEANSVFACFGVSPNSVLNNEEIEVKMTTGVLLKSSKNASAVWEDDSEIWVKGSLNPAVCFSIRNKTQQTIYLDLANTFYVTMGQSNCYYVPTATTTSNTSSGGASVNLGAVTGALGIGGVAGTLANGVNVGGGSSSTTTNTTYSQRIMAIAPLSTVNLSPKYLFCNKAQTISTGLKYDLSTNLSYNFSPFVNFSSKSQTGTIMFGDHYTYNSNTSPIQLSFFAAYSNKENCTEVKVVPSYYYLKDLLGNYVSSNLYTWGSVSNKNVPYIRMIVTDNKKEDSFPKQ